MVEGTYVLDIIGRKGLVVLSAGAVVTILSVAFLTFSCGESVTDNIFVDRSDISVDVGVYIVVDMVVDEVVDVVVVVVVIRSL